MIRWLAHLTAASPALWLIWATVRDQLGADPIAELSHETGQWALRLLLACLAMTPLRRITGHSGWLGYRRMLGLWAFAYASLHLAVYLVLDLGGYWRQILDDLSQRPYIMAGASAWLLLLPLALTSTRAAIRRLGRQWRRLHRLIYPAVIAAGLHFVWLVKADPREPLIYIGITAVLLALRLPLGRRSAATPTTRPNAGPSAPARRSPPG